MAQYRTKALNTLAAGVRTHRAQSWEEVIFPLQKFAAFQWTGNRSDPFISSPANESMLKLYSWPEIDELRTRWRPFSQMYAIDIYSSNQVPHPTQGPR